MGISDIGLIFSGANHPANQQLKTHTGLPAKPKRDL